MKTIPYALLRDTDYMRRLVSRVMLDGDMTRLEACNFVAGMVQDAVGWDVYLAIDEDHVRRRTQAEEAAREAEQDRTSNS